VFAWIFREFPSDAGTASQLRDGISFVAHAQAVTCGLALLPVTILFGFNFPRCSPWFPAQNWRRRRRLSGGIGIAAAANTVGAIFAAIIADFLITTCRRFSIGGYRSFIECRVSCRAFCCCNRPHWKPLLAAAVLFAAIFWTARSPLFFSKTAAAFGVVLYGNYHSSALTAREIADTEDVVFFKDGITPRFR